MDEQTEQRIIDRLNGQISEEDAVLLDRWLQESDAHRAAFEELQRVHRRLMVLKEDFAPDVAGGLARIKSHRQKRISLRRWMSYAAVGLLLVGLGVAWWTEQQQGESVSGAREYACLEVPVKKQAYLVLSDGKHVFIPSEVKDSVLVREEQVTVRIDTGRMLHYQHRKTGAEAMQKLVVPNGGEYRLMLEDGSVVWLNSSSELEFPAGFGPRERRVRLKGEGYFKVQRDTLRPFRVETEKMTVKVLGTEFNLAAYADETGAAATLVKGAVEVCSPSGASVCLQPGQQLLSDGERMRVQQADVAAVVSWLEGKFRFEETALSEIMRQVGRWYDVEYTFAREELKDIRFSGAIQKFRPLGDLLRMIEATAPVRFAVKEGHLIITEK